MTFIYLDTETTGLDPNQHQVWEIAWAVDDGPVESIMVQHSLANADPKALELNGYWERSAPRCVLGSLADARQSVAMKRDSTRAEFQLQTILDGATLVGANPAFDAAMLRARWGRAPWHYRMIDIETYAMPWLGLDAPKSLAYIAEELGVTAPNHTATADVHTLRECHRALIKAYDSAIARQEVTK